MMKRITSGGRAAYPNPVPPTTMAHSVSLGRRSTDSSLLQLARATVDVPAKHYNPTTWPKHFTADDIKRLLVGHLSSASTHPHYDSLAMLLHSGDTDSLTTLVRVYTMPPSSSEGVVVEQFLSKRLGNNVNNNNNNDDELSKAAAAMPMHEHTNELFTILQKALPPWRGSEKRNILCCTSSLGGSSGTTQFVKTFVSSRRHDAAKYGRVIVCRCNLPSEKELPWMRHVFEEELLTNVMGGAPDTTMYRGLCELVRSHVESVTGCPQDPSKYCDPQTAYATWISETAWYFGIPPNAHDMEPLIVLASCEELADRKHRSLVHRSSGKPYTLLEAFCLVVPSPHSVFVIGSDAHIDTTDPVMLSIANVRVLELGGVIRQ